MNPPNLQEILLQTVARVSQIQAQLQAVAAKEERINTALSAVRQRVINALREFDRDKYKATDQRLAIGALASELLIFDKLGYDLGNIGARFLLGVAALLQGRQLAALEYFTEFVAAAPPDDANVGNAHYLAGMICYNRREYARASEHFQAAFRLSPQNSPDWQSRIYLAELTYFMRKPREVVEKVFFDLEQDIKAIENQPQHDFLRATLYLKLGNCYVGTFLEPRDRNDMVNTPIAVDYYKQARHWCTRSIAPESLLPVIVDFSLAQALVLIGSLDMDLSQTPSELLADVFQRLRRLVLGKREEIILAQCYFMLAMSAYYSMHLPKETAAMYLEYARHETLMVPSDVCFYSCITKELLTRDDFVHQIDSYAGQTNTPGNRR